MEEDIKDIELFIDFCRKSCNFEHEVDEKNYAELSNKLENLIKAYKEKEYKYNKALNDLVQAEHENKELKEENRSYEDEIQEQAKDLMSCEETIRDEYIPISLVKEKIEKYKQKIKQYNEYKEQGKETDVEFYENIINIEIVSVLQKLLERS